MGIVTNVYFIAIAGAGMLFLVLSSTQAGQIYGTATWPVTYQVIELLAGSFGLFVLIVITFYAGELAWQERDRRMNQVHDALPIPTWVPFLGKLSALVLVVLTLQCLLIACGLGLQASKGYFRFEPLLYVKELLGLQLVNWTLMIALIMLIHSLVNNKYLGHFIVILYFIGRGFLGRLGLEHLLFHYGSDPGTTYSDMNRFGPFLDPFGWYKLYWGGFALLLAVLSNLFWVRGQETAAGWRLALARQRFTRPALVFAAGGLVLAVAAGAFIFWNTNVRNEYRTSFQQQELSVRYEKEYKQYEDLAQPRITASKVDVTLWPKEHRGRLAGTLTAVNKTSVAIPAVHVQIPAEADVASMTFNPPATKEKDDEELGYEIWRLAEPLQPGQGLTLAYDVSYAPKGFTNSGASTTIVDNGTFINSGLVPSFGYSENGELGDDDTRRKHGLEPKERMAPVDDLKARANTYISRDADWIDFEATVCTDPDQLAIAPGYLKREFEREGRRCFEYAMDAPILNFYSFLSARYVVERDSWHDVAIEVWHHPGHEYNVKRMIEATKAALEYYTTRFTPYQHRQVRILEFPRYASFAQSFPNTIPYSESIGFIARVKDPAEDIDYPFYVTAHEVAHQWFAHQVIGGNVQGSTMLSESFSQYAALKVMEAAFGRATMVKFLKYERDRYLQGRALERKKELPLLLVENQQYIHYNKGSVVLYAIADYIGEDKFNAALKTYLEKVRFQEPPYTNSLEFLAELRAVTPPDMQYLLDDMLVNITLYDLRTTSATAARLADGTWEVVLEIDAKKLRADEEGTETEVPMNDLIDVGAFLQGPGGKLQDLEPLAVERVRLVSGKQTVKLKTSRKPEKAGVNHRGLLIDRIDSDDIVKVEDPKS
jgi:ABC-2 type transport system permease protein